MPNVRPLLHPEDTVLVFHHRSLWSGSYMKVLGQEQEEKLSVGTL